MSEEEIAEQAMIAATFSAAIAAMEAQLGVTDETLGLAEATSFEGQDAEAVQQLLDCLAETNAQIASGDLALADIGFAVAEDQANA